MVLLKHERDHKGDRCGDEQEEREKLHSRQALALESLVGYRRRG